MRALLLLLVLCVIGIPMYADYDFYQPTFDLGSGIRLGSLINPEKVKMNQSMSFSSGASSTGNGFYQSAYTNQLQFDLRDNLKLNVDMSFVNLGTMTHQNDLKFSGNDDNRNVLIPGVSMQYKPTDNTTIYIEYKQSTGYGSPFGMGDSLYRY